MSVSVYEKIWEEDNLKVFIKEKLDFSKGLRKENNKKYYF